MSRRKHFQTPSRVKAAPGTYPAGASQLREDPRSYERHTVKVLCPCGHLLVQVLRYLDRDYLAELSTKNGREVGDQWQFVDHELSGFYPADGNEKGYLGASGLCPACRQEWAISNGKAQGWLDKMGELRPGRRWTVNKTLTL